MFDEYDDMFCGCEFYEVDPDPAQSDLEEVNFDDQESDYFEDTH